MNDIDALINLLTHSSYTSNRPIIELIENSQKLQYIILAENFSYNEKKKKLLKEINICGILIKKFGTKMYQKII